MSTSIPRPIYGFTLTLATSGFISFILAISPSLATPNAVSANLASTRLASARLATMPVSSNPTPNYVPPARETPLRTESAGVRMGGEKGPTNVTQNTIATERLISYSPGIAPILDWIQTLILRTQDQSRSRPQKQP